MLFILNVGLDIGYQAGALLPTILTFWVTFVFITNVVCWTLTKQVLDYLDVLKSWDKTHSDNFFKDNVSKQVPQTVNFRNNFY